MAADNKQRSSAQSKVAEKLALFYWNNAQAKEILAPGRKKGWLGMARK